MYTIVLTYCTNYSVTAYVCNLGNRFLVCDTLFEHLVQASSRVSGTYG